MRALRSYNNGYCKYLFIKEISVPTCRVAALDPCSYAGARTGAICCVVDWAPVPRRVRVNTGISSSWPKFTAAVVASAGFGLDVFRSNRLIYSCIHTGNGLDLPGSRATRAALYNRNRRMTIPSSLPSYMDWHWLWLTVAAFVAGVLNAVAGGGSFLLFPAMLSMRMLPVQANATNTVALWPGQFTSVFAYREDIRKNLRLAMIMGVAGLLGGTAGAIVLLNTPQRTFLRLVPWLLLVASIIFALSGPVSRRLGRSSKARRGGAAHATHAPRRLPVFLLTVVVCFYVGYFGAGAGFVIITLLSLFGFQDMNEINALKVVSTTMANGIAFLIFVFDGQVVWRYCLLAMITCAIGGYTSARFARMIPQKILRGAVILIGFAMSAWFFWKIP